MSRASRALGPGRGRRRGCGGRTSLHKGRQRSRPSASRGSRRRGCRRCGSLCRGRRWSRNGSLCRGRCSGSRRGSCRGGSPWFAESASFLFRGGCRSLARLGLALARPTRGSRTARTARLIAADELGVQHLQMGPTARVAASSLAHRCKGSGFAGGCLHNPRPVSTRTTDRCQQSLQHVVTHCHAHPPPPLAPSHVHSVGPFQRRRASG